MSKLKLEEPDKCNCGYASCDRWQFNSSGMFYQGCGFPREVATEIRRRVNVHEEMLAALEKVVFFEVHMSGMGRIAIHEAREAIAKARGEEA